MKTLILPLFLTLCLVYVASLSVANTREQYAKLVTKHALK